MKQISPLKSLLFILTLSPFASFASNPDGEAKMIFEENKNQWPSQVRFMTDIVNGRLFLEKNTFTYLFTDSELHDHDEFTGPQYSVLTPNKVLNTPVERKSHSIRVNFQNSNPKVQVFGDNLQPGIRNYYIGNDKNTWAENIKLYSQVYYKDLYTSIDMKVYNEEQNLKYDFIVNPGGSVKNIQLNYKGADDLHLEYGHLYIKTSVGTVIEQKPYAYQKINGFIKQIPCSYQLKNNILSFAIGEYDKNISLVIDPTLIAFTYAGSKSDNRGLTATYDGSGNIYIGGKVLSNGYPVTTGVVHASPGFSPPLYDCSFSRFNSTGTTLTYATLFGGNSDEQPQSIIVNGNNQLYAAGRTFSTNLPIPGPAAQSSPAGGWDMFAVKFGPTGALQAATYFGGTNQDGINVTNVVNQYVYTKYTYGDDGRSEIILDAGSNVYITGCTWSGDFCTAGKPAIPGYNQTFNGSPGSTQDAFVIKLNSTLSGTIFATYLGGSGFDAGYGLKVDGSNTVYTSGGTTSTDMFNAAPAATSGVINPVAPGGGTDGYIAVLNSAGTSLLRATYLGTAAYDQSYFLEIDVSGDLYVMGQTMGTYPVVGAGVYSNPGGTQFIHKIKGNLQSTVFSTVVGSGPGGVNISPTAFLVDSCQTIYFSGWGRCGPSTASGQWLYPNPGGTTGMPVTANAYQSTTDGCDYYFMVLNPNAKGLSYATFFGVPNQPTNPDHVDGGTSRFDKRGLIYEAMCASCLNSGNISTGLPAYSPTNQALDGAQCNEAVVKMDVAPKPIASVHATSPQNGCAPFNVSFDNSGSVATNYIYDFGDGAASYITTPSYTYNYPGTYTVTLYAIDSVGICGFSDTAQVVIKVGAHPVLVPSVSNVLCAPQNTGSATVSITPTGATQPLAYAWSPSGGTGPIATGLDTGVYTVTVTDALGCSSSQTVSITEPPILTLTTSATPALCGQANGGASATAGGGVPGYTYAWSNGKTTASISGVIANPYTVILTDANGCTKSQVATVINANGPQPAAAAATPVSCNGGADGSASVISTGGQAPFTYAWFPSAGSNTTANGLIAGNYTIVVTDANGCTGQDTVNVNEPPFLAISVTSAPTKCLGGSNDGTATVVTTGGTGAYTYVWSTTPAQNTATATGLNLGTYTVTVTDANGCSATQPVKVNNPPTGISINAFPTAVACGTSATGGVTVNTVNGAPQYTYLWSTTPPQTIQSPSHLVAGTYSVTVWDANGCSQTDTVLLAPRTEPKADFIYVPNVACDGVTYHFTSTSTNAVSYYWAIPGIGTSTDANPSFLFPYNNTYNITLTVTNPPCDNTVTKPLNVGDFVSYVKLGEANVFTPNHDNINDCFHPAIIDMRTGLPNDTLIQCTKLEVFDRWGRKMFESVGLNGQNCWDGMNKNDSKEAVDGTYFYIASLGDTKIKGYVTLVREKNK